MRWWKHGGEALSLSLTLSLFLSVVAKRVGEGVYGRWVVIFVPASSLISPHLLRAVALTPRRASPHLASPHHAAPRRATPRRDAGQRSRGAGWCAVVLVRMHISVPHILIQGVITRLSSAHSHHCLNHPPPPSSSSRQHLRVSPRCPLPRPVALHLHLLLLHLLHLQPPPSSCGSPSPTRPPHLACTNLYYPPAGRIFLQTGPSFPMPSPADPFGPRGLSDTQVSSLSFFPFPSCRFRARGRVYVLASVLALGDTWGRVARIYSRVSVVTRASRLA